MGVHAGVENVTDFFFRFTCKCNKMHFLKHNSYSLSVLLVLIGFLSITCSSSNVNHDQQHGSSRENSTHYKAAVVEYQPEGSPWSETGPEIIAKNIANYLHYIANASANNVDIIVFPEYGLTTLGIPRDRDFAKQFLLRVPPIGSNPCKDADNLREFASSPEIRTLSCASQFADIYLVVNLGEIRDCNEIANCPPDQVFQFNTNVVFDRNGTIVAKYEKANLYFEDQFDKPDPISLSTFWTDFGVEFGLFTCFDIIFHNPAIQLVESGIKHFIFPTAWVDELPFLMAIQAQGSWAYGANANLLAAGYHQPLGGQLGSGLYKGVGGAVKYTFNSDSGSEMLIGELPINLPTSSPILHSTRRLPTSNISAYHNFLREDLQNYTTTIINLDAEQERICTHNGFCCEIRYKMKSASFSNYSQNYRLIAFNGTRTVAAKTAEYDWQVCGIVRCLNASLESCCENDKSNGEDNLPNFDKIELQSRFDIGRNSEDGANFLPTFNTLDVQFDLISPSLFKIETNSETGDVSAVSVDDDDDSVGLANARIKTLAFINKLFDE